MTRVARQHHSTRRLGARAFAAMLVLTISAGCFGCRVPAASPDPAPKLHRVGLLSSRSQQPWYGALSSGMQELGYVEGTTFEIKYRFADGAPEVLPRLSQELIDLGVEAIVVADTSSLSAARSLSASVPIVMALGGDPVASGAVASMARPGGNVTGLSSVVPSLAGKRIEVLRAALPGLTRVGVLRNPDNPARANEWPDLLAAARSLDVTVVDLPFSDAADLDRQFEAAVIDHVDAIIVVGEPLIAVERERIARLARTTRIPLMYERGDLLDSGGLISYGVPLSQVYRRAAAFVDRIIRGANPADLPIEVPARYELGLNLQTAAELGLALSPALLAQADRLIP